MENEFLDRAQLEKNEETEQKKKAKKRTKVKSTKQKKPSAFVQILNGDFLTKEFILNNLNFLFFLMLLLLLIVGKGYYGKQLSNDVIRTQKELNEATSEYFEAKAKLEEETRRTVLSNSLEPIGLKETENPTKVIRIKKNNVSK